MITMGEKGQRSMDRNTRVGEEKIKRKKIKEHKGR